MRPGSLRAEEVRDRVRVSVADSMDGLPVTVNRMSLNINPDATLPERKAMADVLIALSEGTTCEVKFWMGDWWNSLSDEYGAKIEELRQMYGYLPEKQFNILYNAFRSAGWIAGKWPPLLRNSRYSWTWHKTNSPELFRIKGQEDNAEQPKERIRADTIYLKGKHSNNVIASTFNTQTQVVKMELKWGKHTFFAWSELIDPQIAFTFLEASQSISQESPPDLEDNAALEEDEEVDIFAGEAYDVTA